MKNNIWRVTLSIIIELLLSLSNSLVGAAAPCSGDFGPDGDVDGTDLSILITSGGLELGSFASEFGRDDCSISTGLLVDTDFEASVDSADLRTNGAGQDWYESRGQDPGLLFLDETGIGGNTEKLS